VVLGGVVVPGVVVPGFTGAAVVGSDVGAGVAVGAASASRTCGASVVGVGGCVATDGAAVDEACGRASSPPIASLEKANVMRAATATVATTETAMRRESRVE
jgi:hypothetical protein